MFGNFVFPENIAHQYLEDPNQSWMITSLNNIVTNSDWYYPIDIKLSELKIKYNNQIIYSILTLPDLIENDIIVYKTENELENILCSGKYDKRFLGDDYRDKKITGKTCLLEIIYIDRSHGYSTTKLKNQILNR